ncbi:MAG: ATP-binding protein, partial [Methylococcaceae bacterium]
QRKQNEAVILLAKNQAESLTRSKSEFLANMSHEIRTPMNAIIGLSQLALNKELSVESRDYLEKIYSSSNSLLSILNDILDFSKLEARRIDIDNLTFNLDVLLDNLSSLFADPAQDKYLDFDIECTPDVPCNLIGDTLRLQQVLVNLLGNAIKFTQQGSVRLNITVSHQGHSQVRLLFCVTDTGIGMSDKDCEKLFQPFSQVDGSITRRFGGTGLGLAISHNLLQLMGSEISVASSLGKGSCFSFELVLGVSSVKAVKPISELVDSSNLLIGKRVLIAEDNLINQRVVGEFLKLFGITIEIANNGKEALALLEIGEFDAVLMDIHMPEMGGFKATRWIRSQVRFATLPIIALTAGVTQEEQEKCLAIGMNDVIAKPIDPKKLFSTLINWIKPIGATTNTTDKLLLEQQSGMNDLPILDLTNLLLMLGNNQKLATRLLLDFRDSMKNVPDEIEAMILAGNWVSAKEKVHLIKGVSSNVGAVKLHAVTKELEAKLKEGASTATFDAFRAAFNQTMSTIGALDQPEEPIPPPGGNSFELKRSIVELELLLKENDFISESFLNVFNSHLSTSQLDLFAQLRKLIDELRYGEAQNILQQLATLSNTKDIV